MFSLVLTHFQPLLECESDDLPLTEHSSSQFIKCTISEAAADHLDCETDHSLFVFKLLIENSLLKCGIFFLNMHVCFNMQKKCHCKASYKMERGKVEGLMQDGRALIEYQSTVIKFLYHKG